MQVCGGINANWIGDIRTYIVDKRIYYTRVTHAFLIPLGIHHFTDYEDERTGSSSWTSATSTAGRNPARPRKGPS
jgi:hypothetical protein